MTKKRRCVGMPFFSSLLSIGLTMLVLTSAGCVFKKPALPAGLSNEVAGFREQAEARGLFEYVHPAKDLFEYNQFVVDKVHVELEKTPENESVDQGQIASLEELTKKELTWALGQKVKLAEQPGPRDLKVRVEITYLKPMKAYSNRKWSSSILGQPVASAVFRAECVDAATEERIWAFAVMPLELKDNIWKGLSKSGYTEGVVKLWLNRMVDQLTRHLNEQKK